MQEDQKELFKILHKLRLPNGFYKASTGLEYQYTWLRDNFYCSLPELWGNPKKYAQTYHTWLDYYKGIERKYNKFSSLINKKGIQHAYEFPNVRINLDLSETITGWNHMQLDTIGYFLYGIAQGEENCLRIIRDVIDLDIVNKVIQMLDAIRYHEVSECGAWEENDENPRASSIGAVVGGLIAIQKIGVEVPQHLIDNGMAALNWILPKETPSRNYDLAQLFLLYPFNILNAEQSDLILKNVEENLLRNKGVIRYIGDVYYNLNGEAEWTFGFAYLGLIYYEKGDFVKAQYYYDKIIADAVNYNIPELYFSGTNKRNENTPLGWSVALTLELAHKLSK